MKRYENALTDSTLGGQLAAKGGTGTSKAAAHGTRDTFEVQLQVVLLVVAQDAAAQPENERAELRRIFPQYILEGRAPTPEEKP
jgi:hypothetical protein